MKLVLGVNPTSYSDPKGIEGNMDPDVVAVAQAIERKYKLMGKFVEMNQRLVGDAVAEMAIKKLEGNDINEASVRKISSAFKDALQLKLFDGKIPGVATKAANVGKRWRKNSPNRGFNRPSFIDTGTYKAAMDAVIKDA